MNNTNSLFLPKRQAHPSLPFRERPEPSAEYARYSSGRDSFEAIITQSVLDEIYEQSLNAKPDEIAGLLAGRTWQDTNGPYTIILAAGLATKQYVESSASRVKVSGAGVSEVRQRIETAHWSMDILGWYHSHPTYTAYFSSVDESEQATWTDPNNIGIVISCIPNEERFGVYRGPRCERLALKPPARNMDEERRLITNGDTESSRCVRASAFIPSRALPGPDTRIETSTEKPVTVSLEQPKATRQAIKNPGLLKQALGVAHDNLNTIVLGIIGTAILFALWRGANMLRDVLAKQENQLAGVEERLTESIGDNQNELRQLYSTLKGYIEAESVNEAAPPSKPATKAKPPTPVKARANKPANNKPPGPTPKNDVKADPGSKDGNKVANPEKRHKNDKARPD